MSDEAKVRFIFRKLHHTGLRSFINALKASKTIGMTLFYTMAANHLFTATSELPEYIAKNARNVSGVQVGDEEKGGGGIYNEDYSINTGHIHSWKLIPFKDQKLVIVERKRLGIRYKRKSGARSGGRGNSNHAGTDSNSFKQSKEQNQKYKCRSKT